MLKLAVFENFEIPAYNYVVSTFMPIVLYIPSMNNAGKNIINKSFNILDSDPVRSRVEGSPAFSRYPGRANFAYISLENSSNRFYEKHRLGSAGTKRDTRLAGPLSFEGRVTLLPGKTFCHAGILGQM